ncbi:MAG: hypothetical protein J7498_09760 [Sphingobium sp.]|nr:hypothetical protein [Sphingobium sp.]
MRGQVGSIFRIDGGDGDQEFFGRTALARRVSEPWFTGTLPRGEAYLLQLTGGEYADEYIAVTSRQAASLSDQLKIGPWISVIVHRLADPGVGFVPTLESAPAIGMAVLEVL